MKRGFTLIELLAIMTILGVILLIAVPSVTSLINNSKEESYKRQIEYIESSARDYMSKNSKYLPDENGSYCINISTIKSNGFLRNEDIIDPRSNTVIDGSVNVTYKNNKYVYTYSENACG